MFLNKTFQNSKHAFNFLFMLSIFKLVCFGDLLAPEIYTQSLQMRFFFIAPATHAAKSSLFTLKYDFSKSMSVIK